MNFFCQCISSLCGLGVEVSRRVQEVPGSNPGWEMDFGQNFKNFPVKYFKKNFLSTLRGILFSHEKSFWVHATSTSYVVKKEGCKQVSSEFAFYQGRHKAIFFYKVFDDCDFVMRLCIFIKVYFKPGAEAQTFFRRFKKNLWCDPFSYGI